MKAEPPGGGGLPVAMAVRGGRCETGGASLARGGGHRWADARMSAEEGFMNWPAFFCV